jgi:hypothetical protein
MRENKDGRCYAAKDEECHGHGDAHQQDIKQVDFGFFWLSSLQRFQRRGRQGLSLRNGIE